MTFPRSTRLRVEALEHRLVPTLVINEFPVPAPDQPLGIVGGPDGNLWFTEAGAAEVGRITPAAAINHFPIISGNFSHGITVGPDGNLWFTTANVGNPPVADSIGRVTVTGILVEFGLPADRNPQGIAAGPDSNLWFTEPGANLIGQMTQAGFLTEFGGLTPNSQPNQITLGSDGALWFTETSANKIGRITTAGLVTEFAVPTANSQPIGITAGPDGNLWFTESAGNKVGILTITGQITEIPLPTASSQPIGIGVGPDNNLWVAERAANQLARITPVNNGIVEFAIPTPQSGVSYVAAGSDGNMWFTETTANQLGQFVLPHGNVDPILATGPGPGRPPLVNVYDALTGNLEFSFMAYDPSFGGGVRVAVADMDKDGVPDIITAPGPSGGADIRVFSGFDGEPINSVATHLFAYDPHFLGGVFVAAGDVNGDGYPDIITGPDQGGGPDVRIYSGKDGTLLNEIFAYDPGFLGGVRVAAGDIYGTGQAQVVTGAGPTGGPHVKVFNGMSGDLLAGFMAYDPRFLGGVYVASGDIDGDGKADIITGAGAGGGPHVEVFRGFDQALIQSFFAYDPRFTGGVRVGFVSDLNTDGAGEIITGAGPGGGPHLRVLDGETLDQLDSFFAYEPTFSGGIFVGGS